MLEREIAAACRKRWDALGLLWRRVEWIGQRGAPDFVVMGDDVLQKHFVLETDTSTVWVETKPTGGKPEAHQLREHERMRTAGQAVLVISSLEELDRWFPL